MIIIPESLKKTVMVSGYFDPIHPGHISYMREASKLGEELIVVIDGDERTAAKKGKPFMPAEDRKVIIEALDFVDFVYIENVNVKEALKRFMPRIFAKGGDRTGPENIPEWDLCEELGIEIVTGVGADKEWSSRTYLQDWADFKRPFQKNLKDLIDKVRRNFP